MYSKVVSDYNPLVGKNYIEAVLDSQSDLVALGTDYAPGSLAVVAASGAPVFMLNASSEWKEL